MAFVGTMNPSSGDVSVFLPLEQARLAETARGDARTSVFARYTFTGALCAAIGALATAIPQLLSEAGMTQLGGHAIWLTPAATQIGHGENAKDTGMVFVSNEKSHTISPIRRSRSRARSAPRPRRNGSSATSPTRKSPKWPAPLRQCPAGSGR